MNEVGRTAVGDKNLRIAYCISVYKNPKQVARLIERIYSPSDYFYIHKDKKISPYEWESILGKYRNENVLLTSRYKCYWGAFGLVEVNLDGMNYCRSFDYDYFINLSGQCYPIKPLSIIKGELEKKSLAYMEYFKLPSPNHWEAERGGLDRINFFHIKFWRKEIPSFRFPRLNKSLPCNLEPYGGSGWFCLPKRFVNYILDFVSKHHEITRFYRYSNVPDEMFFQTILMNSPLKSGVVDDNKRYINWKNKSSPEIFREENFKDIVQSDKLFARKFDINIDKNILDLIDRKILNVR
jgi:hypothetical protein